MASSARSFSRAVSLLRQPHHITASCSRISTRHFHRCINRTGPPSTSILQCRFISHSSRLGLTQPAAIPTKTSSPTPSTSSTQPISSPPKPTNLKSGFDQPNMQPDPDAQSIDWSKSFQGLADAPFAKEAADALLKPIDPVDIEIKPDGIIFLPEIKYRRILNKAFGPGGWGLAPRGESTVTAKAVTREYALLAQGRLVSIARGEQDYFSAEGIPTAVEGCKSNAMMRCCKDLGVASELWDPRFIRKFKAEHARDAWVEHAVSKKKQKIWTRKGDPIPYPWKESKLAS